MKLKTAHTKNKKVLIITIIVLLLAALMFGVYAYKSQTLKDETSQQSTSEDETENTSDSSVPSTTQTKPDKDGSNEETEAIVPDSGVMPVAPAGTFVSNHYPNIDGSPAPSTLSSTCTTSPGVQCKISFTKGAITKSLGVHTTDVNGNTSWEWNINEIGLDVGEWSVVAVAINGDKTASSTDSIKLTIGE